MSKNHQINEELDLVLERIIDVPVELVWKAWTEPEHLIHWFTPSPWKTIACKIDLKPGGEFSTTMLSPEGQEFPNIGCILEVITNKRLVFTDALGPGYRPSANPFMTAIIELESEGTGTKYRAIAIHKDTETKTKHSEMGFQEGWGKALEQLIEYSKKI